MSDNNPLIGGTAHCKQCGEMTYPDDCCTCKHRKAEPTEVRMIDVLIEVRALRGEINQLKRRVEELEKRPRLPRICK